MQKSKIFLRRLCAAVFLAKNASKFEYGAQKPLQASFFSCIITKFKKRPAQLKSCAGALLYTY